MLKRARRLYRADLEHLDASVELVFSKLEADAEEFTTHIFVMSDHGESFGEGGSLSHGNRLTDVEIRIPAFIISPAVKAESRADVAGVIDVTPTVLSLAGIAQTGATLGGRDLSAQSDQASEAWGMTRTYQTESPRELRIDGKLHELQPYYFFVVDSGGGVHRGNQSLIVPASDTKRPPEGFKRKQLAARFAALEEQIRAVKRAEKLDPESEAALEALGYIP